MLVTELLDLLNEDLSREYAHWHFYMYAASAVSGLDREEYAEFFKEAAASEMNHIGQFSNMIRGLGGIPTVSVAPFPSSHTNALDLVEDAIQLEAEVVKNYAERMDQTEQLSAADRVSAYRICLFLENQFDDSHTDLDHLRQIANKFK